MALLQIAVHVKLVAGLLATDMAWRRNHGRHALSRSTPEKAYLIDLYPVSRPASLRRGTPTKCYCATHNQGLLAPAGTPSPCSPPAPCWTPCWTPCALPLPLRPSTSTSNGPATLPRSPPKGILCYISVGVATRSLLVPTTPVRPAVRHQSGTAPITTRALGPCTLPCSESRL